MLQDSITLQWDASVIAVVLAPYVVNNQIDTVGFFLDWLGRLDRSESTRLNSSHRP